MKRRKIERAAKIIERSFGVLQLSPTTDDVAYYYQTITAIPPMDGRPLYEECNQRFIAKTDMHRGDDAWLRQAALIEEDVRRECASRYCRKFELDEAA